MLYIPEKRERREIRFSLGTKSVQSQFKIIEETLIFEKFQKVSSANLVFEKG